MLRQILALVVCLFFSSCGGLTVSPSACKTSGIWGSNKSFDDEEKMVSETYYVVTTDTDVKIKDILSKNKIKCDRLNTIRIKIVSTFFIKQEVRIYYTELAD